MCNRALDSVLLFSLFVIGSLTLSGMGQNVLFFAIQLCIFFSPSKKSRKSSKKKKKKSDDSSDEEEDDDKDEKDDKEESEESEVSEEGEPMWIERSMLET